MRRPPLKVFPSTLWEYPSQHYDMKDADGSTAPNSLGEVNNYAEEVTVTFDAAGKVASSKVTWSSEPSWLTESRYSARTLLMEMKPGGTISVGRWAQPS